MNLRVGQDQKVHAVSQHLISRHPLEPSLVLPEESLPVPRQLTPVFPSSPRKLYLVQCVPTVPGFPMSMPVFAETWQGTRQNALDYEIYILVLRRK